MTYPQFSNLVDQKLPDNIMESVGPDDLRDIWKQLASTLYGELGARVLQSVFDPIRQELARTSLGNMWVSAISEGQAVDNGDDTQFIRNSILNANGRGVWFPPKVYRVSANIQLPDNCQVEFAKGASIIVTSDYADTVVDGNSTRYVFLMGKNSSLRGANIDCGNHVVGGILSLSKINVRISDCLVKKWTVTGFGIGIISNTNCWVENNTLLDGGHGINLFRSKNCHVSGNITNRNFSGIYLVACINAQVVANNTQNNIDVGVDFEHCMNCFAYLNYSARSRRGEYAIFSGGDENADQGVQHNVIFRNNVAVRQATYVVSVNSQGVEQIDTCDDTYGACAFHSTMAGAYNVGFESNMLYVEFSGALSSEQVPDKTNRDIFFRDNRVVSTSGRFWRCLDTDGLSITDNKFYGKATVENGENETRDGHGLRIIRNTFEYNVPKSAGYAILVNTSTTFATKAPVIYDNKFINANGYAIKIDTYMNGSLLPLVRKNDLGDSYTADGGILITDSGNARLKDQAIRVRMSSGLTDFNTISALSKAGASKAFGNVGAGRDGYNGLAATVAWIYGSGAFATSLNSIGGLTLTPGGSGLTFSNTTGATVYAYMDMTVNTYN